MAGAPVGRGIEAACRQRDRLNESVEARRLHHGVVPIGGQPSVAVGAQPHALLRRAAMCSGVEDLRARHRHFYRPAQHARADRRQRCVDVIRQFVAEAAADVTRDDPHILGRNVERSRETFAGAGRELRRRADGQHVALPERHARVGLHRG